MAWALAGSVIAWRCWQPWALVGALGAAIALLIGIHLIAFRSQVWLPGGAPLVALIASSIAMSLYAEQATRRQFETVRRLLGQQTSPRSPMPSGKPATNYWSPGNSPAAR